MARSDRFVNCIVYQQLGCRPPCQYVSYCDITCPGMPLSHAPLNALEVITAYFSICIRELYISQPTAIDNILNRFLFHFRAFLCVSTYLMHTRLLTHSLAHTPPLSDTWQCDIIQLAAISGVHTFNIYMMPQVAIDRGATAVNGFSVSDGALLLRGTAIPTATLTEALTSFLDFLRSLEQPVLLAAHNARRFDKPVLDRALLGCSLARQFQQLGSRFLDTLPLSRALHPGLDSHSLVNLSGYFLPRHYNAHDALEDVRALQELYNCWNPRQGTLDQFVF